MRSFFLLSLLSFNAFAWGPTGHRVVGAVAEKNLDPKVLVKAREILGGSSLSRVANYPDEIRSEPEKFSYTFNWHYTDWADEAHDHDETSSSGILLTSLKNQLKILKDPASPAESKTFALKFVVHLIGDLHQPLHVGNGLDQGGNLCKVTFHGTPTNLHALWDEGLIDYTKLSFTEMASFVAQGRSRNDVLQWKTGDVLDWAQESKTLRMQIYPANPKAYCQAAVAVDEMPKLSYEYSYKFVPMMEQRLYQAGLRLAVILNQNL
jgi:S1/P1 Nuclease